MAQQLNHSRNSHNGDLEQLYRRSANSRNRRRRRRARRIASLITLCIAVVAIGAIVAGSIFIYNKSQHEDQTTKIATIADGISIAGVDVGGMTETMAIQAVEEAVKTIFSTPMTINVLDAKYQISPSVSKVTLDVQDAVNAAFEQDTPGPIDLLDHLRFDENAIKAELDELGTKYNSQLVNSTAKVTGTAPDLTLVVNIGVPRYSLDTNKLYRQILAAYSSQTFVVKGDCNVIEPSSVNLQPYWAVYHVDPIDASFNFDNFTVNESSLGYGFDIKLVNKLIETAAYGSIIEIPFTAIQPEVKTEDLRNLLYRDTLSTYTAKETDSSADRNTNLRLACEAINGLIIYPNEVFSFNESVGERTEARGYCLGPTIINGTIQNTIGGGIDQVSSVLYYCALLADLEIEERNCHSLAPDYMTAGLDAAVSWGTMDFCFKNNTNYPIRIDAVSDGGKVTIKLIGTDEKDYYIQIECDEDTAKRQTPTITEQHMPKNNSFGYTEGDYMVKPYTGCYITTYRCKYKIGTDELISKEKESISSYSKRDGIICVIIDTSILPENPGSQLPGIGNGFVTEDGELD